MISGVGKWLILGMAAAGATVVGAGFFRDVMNAGSNRFLKSIEETREAMVTNSAEIQQNEDSLSVGLHGDREAQLRMAYYGTDEGRKAGLFDASRQVVRDAIASTPTVQEDPWVSIVTSSVYAGRGDLSDMAQTAAAYPRTWVTLGGAFAALLSFALIPARFRGMKGAFAAVVAATVLAYLPDRSWGLNVFGDHAAAFQDLATAVGRKKYELLNNELTVGQKSEVIARIRKDWNTAKSEHELRQLVPERLENAHALPRMQEGRTVDLRTDSGSLLLSQGLEQLQSKEQSDAFGGLDKSVVTADISAFRLVELNEGEILRPVRGNSPLYIHVRDSGSAAEYFLMQRAGGELVLIKRDANIIQWLGS